MDREKIMKALECLAQHHATCSCGECEYWDSRLGYDECERRMAPDIIALLKEQEERIKMLEHQLETITKWRANAGAFD